MLARIAMLVVLPSLCAADTLMTLEDFDAGAGAWGRTSVVAEPAHSGAAAIRWDVHAQPSLDSPRFQADWSRFDELRFWAHSEKTWDFSIPLVFVAPGGYYLVPWKIDWEGWKEQRIDLKSARPAHSPAGWDKITSFGYRPQGYGQRPVPEGLVLVLDSFALHSPEDLPQTNMLDWIAAGRRARMQELKATGNPYYAAALAEVANVDPEPDLPTEIPSSWSFAGLTTRALTAAWAAGREESPRRGDQVLIDHAAALIDFCLDRQKDGSWFYAEKYPQRADPNSDRFALGPLMDAVYWLRKLPDMEDRWAEWEAPLKQMVDFQYEKWWRYDENGYTDNVAWGSSSGTYPNQDVFHLFEMAAAYEFWGDEKYAESARGTLQALWDHLLPEGGLNYIGPETEIPGYHDLNILWIARYYNLTGDKSARELLEKTAPYYPSVCSNEGRPEYFTDCWWKHYWSKAAACGPEIIAGLTRDPHNKWLANRLLESEGTGSGYRAIYAGMFYREDVPEEPLPDNWLRIDANIGGPRGRFGDWYFAGVTGGGARDTFVGAMVSRPERTEPLDGALLAANVEVILANADGTPGTKLYISGSDDTTATAIDGDFTALGARYTVRKPYINSVRGQQVAPTHWRATQVWLLSRHGLVGLVDVEAAEEQTVSSINGNIRLGPNGNIAQTPGGAYRLGSITAQILEHNFATVEHGLASPGYAQTSTTHQAVQLQTAGDSFTARPGEPLRYCAIIAPEGAPELTGFKRVQQGSIFAIRGEIGGIAFLAAFNPSEAEATLDLAACAMPQAAGTRLVPPGEILLLTASP